MGRATSAEQNRGAQLINGKTDPHEILSDDLGRGSVVFVKWSSKTLTGRHYTRLGEHECDLPRDIRAFVKCLAPTHEGSFKRPGYSDEEQFSEGIVRERVSRFWTITRSELATLTTGPHRPVTLVAGVSEGKSTIARFAFALNTDAPVVHYHGAGFGFVLEDQLLHHPALGRPLAIDSSMEGPEQAHHKPARIGIYTHESKRHLVGAR